MNHTQRPKRNAAAYGLAAPALAAVLLAVAAPGASARHVGATTPGVPNPADFTTTIDNPFLPFAPGTRMSYRSSGDDGPGTEVVNVTHHTKLIQGVTTVVVHDVARQHGAVVEDTFDWYAQDRKGNVWYFGEDTKELDNGKVVSTEGSWQAGQHGAEAGIVMEARPRVGDTYRQEFAKGVAEDQATVLSRRASRTVPAGSFDHLLVTKDFSPLEPTVAEHKFYARGVGSILERKVMGGKEKLVLVRVVKR